MIYLDNAATSYPKPFEVIGAVNRAFSIYGANPGRSGHDLSVTSAMCVYSAREELNELFGIEFEGLDVSKRLFLPEDMLETQGKGQIMVTPLSELVEKNLGGDGK